MKNKSGDILAVLAAVLLMFTPVLDPWITCSLGVALLLGMGIYHFARKS